MDRDTRLNYEMENLELLYEQYQREAEREKLATVTTPEEDAAVLPECQDMARRAEEDEGYTNRCLAGEKVFYYSYPKGLMPGHIYSKAGMDEYFISKSFEYHFDEWTAEPDEEDEPVDEFYYNEPDAPKPF